MLCCFHHNRRYVAAFEKNKNYFSTVHWYMIVLMAMGAKYVCSYYVYTHICTYLVHTAVEIILSAQPIDALNN